MTGPGQTRDGGQAAAGSQDSMLGIKLVIAWAIVGVPLAWGVWKVVLSALKLFK